MTRNLIEAPALTNAERTLLLRTLNEAPGVADIALTYIVRCLDHSRVAGRVYARRHRIKDEADVERKINAKRRQGGDKANYRFKNITDIVGFRFITLYRDDISAVTEIILGAILGEVPGIGASPFERAELEEFRLHVSNTLPKSDALAARIKDIATRLRRPGDRWEYKDPELEERYSSVHFVTWMKAENSRGADIRIPIEIQIRSVFEDAWGEVDHALLYESRREGEPLEGVLGQIERQSNALKKMMDAAADFADSIRSLKALENPPFISLSPTIDGPNYVGDVCREINVPTDVVKHLMALIDQKEELDAIVARGGRSSMLSRGDYTRIADEFATLEAHLEVPGAYLAHRERGAEERQLFYILRMEEAVSRLLSFDPLQLPVAIETLRQLVKEFPAHPIAWIRLGEATVRLVEALGPGSKFEAAAAQADNAFQKAAAARATLDELPPRQRLFAASEVHEQFIDQNLARLHAYLIWRSEYLARDGTPPNHRSLDALRRAFAMSFAAHDRVTEAKERRLHFGGLVFYAAECIEAARALGTEAGLSASSEELRKCLEEMETWAVDLDAEQRLSLWDSIAFLRWVMDGDAAAMNAAKQVLLAGNELAALPQRMVTDYRHEMEAKAQERALRILGIKASGQTL